MHRTILIITIISVLSAGCNFAGLTPQIDIPPTLVQQSKAVTGDIQDAHLRVEIELRNALLKDKQVLEIWYVRPDSFRLEVMESTQPAFKDVIAASQAGWGWVYKHANRQVTTGPIETVKPAIIYDVIHSAVNLLWESGLDTVQSISTGYVNGQWVFRLVGTQNEDACILWLQKESFLPVKLQCDSGQLGEYTLTIREAEYNIGLTGDLFNIAYLPTETYTIRRIEAE